MKIQEAKEVFEMARPKKYDSSAAKQAAYRARQEANLRVVDRGALDALHERLERLHRAIAVAATRGDPFALRCRAASIDSTLDKLVDAFSEGSCPRVDGASQT